MNNILIGVSDLSLYANAFLSVFFSSSINSHIYTISEIGMISATGIYCEIGNIAKFNNSSQLTAYAGLDCSRYQSGESEYTGHMVKHGSSYLREYLMNCAETTLIHNPVLYEYSLKPVRIIFSLEKNNTDFESTKKVLDS